MKKFLFLLFFLFFSLSLYASPPFPGKTGYLGPKDSVAPSLGTKKAKSYGIGGAVSPVGTIKLIILRVRFSDLDFSASSDYNYFQNLLNNMKSYYQEVSNNKLTIDVTISNVYNLGNTEAYYGANPETPQRRFNLIKDAINKADGDINFSQYNSIIIIHSGIGEESDVNGDSPNQVWSTYLWWEGNPFIGTPLTVDGVTIQGAVIVPELETQDGGTRNPLGVYCHEFGHQLGLPDLYDTNSPSQNFGVGKWSLMSSGNWLGSPWGSSPAHPDAWSKIFLGWSTPQNITTNTGDVNISPIENGGNIYRLWTNGSTGNQYFLIENRQKTGYDSFLPGAGLLIWHIDDGIGSVDNNDVNSSVYSHKRVDLEEADGLAQLDSKSSQGDGGDTFPGTNNNQNFNKDTNPNSKDYNNNDTLVQIRNIKTSGANIIADLWVASPNLAPTLSSISPANGGGNSTVSVEISGSNFSSGATAKLSKTGANDILATSLSVVSSSKITCQFNLNGATSGTYDLTLKNSDGQSVTLPSSFTVDNTPPVISNISVINITANTAIISWTTDENSTSLIEYGLDTNYGSQTSLDNNLVANHSQPLSNLSQQTNYHFRVRSKDSYGNESTSSDNNFTTTNISDTTSPTIDNLTSSTHPNQSSFYSNKSPSFSWSGSDTGGSGLKGYYYLLDTNQTIDSNYLQTNGTFTTSSSYNASNVSDGTFYLHLKAIDNAGNSSSVVDYKINIDTTGPSITHTPPTSIMENTALNITGSISDERGVKEANLFYKKTNDANYTQVSLKLITGNFHTTIPASSITPQGLQYYIQTKDALDNQTITSVYNISVVINLTLSEVHNYPNPASNQVSFIYTKSGNVDSAKLEIFNLSGEPITTLYDNDKDGKIDYTCSNISNGIYLYKLTITSGNVNLTKKGKFVVVK